MKIRIRPKVTTEADVRVLHITAKCSDCCSAELRDADGNAVWERDGYVPSIMPGDHYGDYVILDIDIETGQILNWRKPSVEELEKLVDEEAAE